MGKKITTLIIIFILTSCNHETKEQSILLPSGMQMRGKIIDGRKEGRWITNYRDNKIYAFGYFYNDKMDGQWTYYNRDGEIIATEFYINGKKNGLRHEYFDGVSEFTVNFVNDSVKGYFRIIDFKNDRLVISSGYINNNLIDRNTFKKKILIYDNNRIFSNVVERFDILSDKYNPSKIKNDSLFDEYISPRYRQNLPRSNSKKEEK